MVCESDAWPSISKRVGSETKKKRGKSRRFFSRYPVKTVLKRGNETNLRAGCWIDTNHSGSYTRTLAHCSYPGLAPLSHSLSLFRSCNLINLAHSAWQPLRPLITRFIHKPVRDFWHSSSCSKRWGSNWPKVSSPTQHATTFNKNEQTNLGIKL